MNKLWIAAGSAFLAMAFPLTAMGGSELQVQEKDGISYISGGVGDAEQQHLKRIADDFSLKVTMATDSGKYMGATSVHIENAESNDVLSELILPPAPTK